MKTIITIIIIVLIALGIWWFRRGPEVVDNTQGAAAAQGLDQTIGGDDSSATSTGNSTDEFDSKG